MKKSTTDLGDQMVDDATSLGDDLIDVFSKHHQGILGNLDAVASVFGHQTSTTHRPRMRDTEYAPEELGGIFGAMVRQWRAVFDEPLSPKLPRQQRRKRKNKSRAKG